MPALIGISSLFLMINYANFPLHEYLDKGFGCNNQTHVPDPNNPEDSEDSEDSYNSFFSKALLLLADVIIPLALMNISACSLSCWRPIARKKTEGDLKADMQNHLNNLKKDSNVASLVNKLETQSNFTQFLELAKGEGKDKYEAVKIIMEVLSIKLESQPEVGIKLPGLGTPLLLRYHTGPSAPPAENIERKMRGSGGRCHAEL